MNKKITLAVVSLLLATTAIAQNAATAPKKNAFDEYCESIIRIIPQQPGVEAKSYYSKPLDGVSFARTIVDGISKIYASVNINKETYEKNAKSFAIFLKSGKKIQKFDETVKIKKNDDGTYNYSVMAELTQEDINLLLGEEFLSFFVYAYRVAAHEDLKYNFTCIVR